MKLSTNESSVTKESVIITTIGTSLNYSSTASLVHDNITKITTTKSTIETVKPKNTTESSSAFKITDRFLNTTKIATVNCNNNRTQKRLDWKNQEESRRNNKNNNFVKDNTTVSNTLPHENPKSHR
ncbi:hypothetical protein PVAND_017677 [Polypedilum vanderplanki]|uniref:Uncharacterized protein n=1 Tax=Polypedilum vanderplanki TaxID=319348 RepID=A0A9J6B8C0_POLVA|nr:hypothetical protein PVAND_017677 [Polypedilum vanderplanki]